MVHKILITGGAGFIGSSLMHYLESSEKEAWIYDDLSRGKKDYIAKIDRLIQGDILDINRLTQAMQGVDTVIHLAAYGSVVESVTDPLPNFQINVSGTQAVLDCACAARVKKMIFASTGGALIGEALPPVDEESLPKPISPYGASKLCGEAYCHAYAKTYDLQTVCLRFANVYGPYSGHKKGAVTKFMKCLMTGEAMPIFGDGSATRDFLHVDDLCEGILQAVKTDIEPGDVFHLASGEETRILDLARTIADITGKPDHPIAFLEKRQSEVTRNFARYEKARKVLGFNPQISLRQGLEETWRWFNENRKQVLFVEETDS